ncbi:MAG: flagellar motor protein MotB [Magnetococcales bacterium]|nr:flagellar motor protein MotB [Magnetococcales bacterium]
MADCPPCKKGAPAWLLTFGDLMSLLLTFFILLISMSTTDKVKFKEAAGSLRDAFGVQRVQQIIPLPTGEDFLATEFQQEVILVHIKEKLQLILENNIDAGEAEIVALDEGFLLRFDHELLMGSGTHKLRPEAKPILLQIASLIKDLPNQVRVEGHTGDEPPPSRYANNWEFSAFKAAAVVDFLATEGSVDPRKLQVRAMGAYAPKVSNATKEGRKENDRIEIMISREPHRPPSEVPELKKNSGSGGVSPDQTPAATGGGGVSPVVPIPGLTMPPVGR